MFQQVYHYTCCSDKFAFLHPSTLIFVCVFFRYGNCVPFVPSPTLNFPTLCDGVYQKGRDYVYISKQKTAVDYSNILKVIGDVDFFFEEEFSTDECTNPLLRMICHYYLPPCGNSTHFEPPTSVCEDACELQSEKCQYLLAIFQDRLMRATGDQLNCSTSILDQLPHSCCNLGFHVPSKSWLFSVMSPE